MPDAYPSGFYPGQVYPSQIGGVTPPGESSDTAAFCDEFQLGLPVELFRLLLPVDNFGIEC